MSAMTQLDVTRTNHNNPITRSLPLMNSIDTKTQKCGKSDRLLLVVSTNKLVVNHRKTFLFYNANCKFLLSILYINVSSTLYHIEFMYF